jgi:hypothetical protein
LIVVWAAGQKNAGEKNSISIFLSSIFLSEFSYRPQRASTPLSRTIADQRGRARIEQRQSHYKLGPFSHLALGLDPPAVRVDDPFDD